MKEETTVINNNKIKFITVLRQIFWDPEREEIEDIDEIENVTEAELKEFKASEKRLKKLEEEHGVEPKISKTRTKRKSIVKKAKIDNVEKGLEDNTKSRPEKDDKIQEI